MRPIFDQTSDFSSRPEPTLSRENPQSADDIFINLAGCSVRELPQQYPMGQVSDCATRRIKGEN